LRKEDPAALKEIMDLADQKKSNFLVEIKMELNNFIKEGLATEEISQR
jgi:hypothetical protein|tara:strand:+ start:9 stop:152 length:144 start_codon:yes stop_codon:yes gene_type:complete